MADEKLKILCLRDLLLAETDRDHPMIAAEIYKNADSYSLTPLAPALSGMPLYMIGGSRDHYAPPLLNCRPLIDAVHAAGGGRILYREFPAGHYGDESRNEISRSILGFFTQNK